VACGLAYFFLSYFWSFVDIIFIFIYFLRSVVLGNIIITTFPGCSLPIERRKKLKESNGGYGTEFFPSDPR